MEVAYPIIFCDVLIVSQTVWQCIEVQQVAKLMAF